MWNERTTARRTESVTVAVVVALALLTGSHAIAGKPTAPKTRMDMPVLSCDTSTQVSIYIHVCAGASGAPAGFTVQWMTAADYAAAGSIWPGCTTDPLTGIETCGGQCDASFSGNANLSRYNLAAGQCVTVDIGEFLFDSGASTSCPNALLCGTEYVFRAFAHANSSLNRSDFTANLSCPTLPCSHDPGCTLTQGYWKTHGPSPTGNNVDEWPVSWLMLGTVTYTDLELQAIFDTSAAGNGLIALAHQLIAAKLNVANGSDDTAIAADIAAADALIGDLVVPPVGSGYLPPSVTSGLTTSLASYNEGATGPGHCD
jgi:hypothetical protein